ncbi:hypothetical protein CF319_g6770 [Tilletia indica]|nr:hypothetical protein CF319_g6770 [Tilletia indica]
MASSSRTVQTVSETQSEAGSDGNDNEKADFSRVSGMRILQPRKPISSMTPDEMGKELVGIRPLLRDSEENLRKAKKEADSHIRERKRWEQLKSGWCDEKVGHGQEKKALQKEVERYKKLAQHPQSGDEIIALEKSGSAVKIKALEEKILTVEQENRTLIEESKRQDSMRDKIMPMKTEIARLREATSTLESERDALIRQVEQLSEQLEQTDVPYRSNQDQDTEGKVATREGSLFQFHDSAEGSAEGQGQTEDTADAGQLTQSPDNRGSSPPWLLDDTTIEDYDSARTYAKGLNTGKTGVDFFTEMRQSMRAALGAAGSKVDPGPFMALINDAGMTKTDLVRMWREEEELSKAAAKRVVLLEARVDYLEVQLTMEKGRAAASTEELLELKAAIRQRNQQLSRMALPTGTTPASLKTKRPADPDEDRLVERRQFGDIVVKRVLCTPPPTSSSRS